VSSTQQSSTVSPQTRPARYRQIEVCGAPRELGRQVGEAAGDEIRRFCAMAIDHVRRTVAVSRESAIKVAQASLPYAERYSPEMVEELRGTAEAARVSLDELMLLQVRNQLRSDADAGCTSLSVSAPRSETRRVAQNWDNDPALDDVTIVLPRRPQGKPALMTVTQAGLIAYIGFNEAGIGLCLNTLPAPSRPLGVPHYFTVRGIYECRSLDDAVQAVRRAERAIPANIMLTTPQGPADLEVTLDDVQVLTGEHGAVTHANHCLHPRLRDVNKQFPELIQSHDRQRRIDACLASASPGAASREQLQDMLRDHTDYPRSICRHANDDALTGFWQTVFSVIIEPELGQMHVSRGTPCNHSYETYRLDG
jgi:isopenicillin-N N-acyltransferase like protein